MLGGNDQRPPAKCYSGGSLLWVPQTKQLKQTLKRHHVPPIIMLVTMRGEGTQGEGRRRNLVVDWENVSTVKEEARVIVGALVRHAPHQPL